MDLQNKIATPDEVALLDLFRKHGRDGRALTLVSLFAMSPLRSDRDRFLATMVSMKQKGLVEPCGLDAVTRKPTGFRLPTATANAAVSAATAQAA